jgi:hypothetical protein
MNRRDALKNTLLAMGYTISVPSVITIFNSCNNSDPQKWQPQFFSAGQASLIGELAETILPKTNTPGAKDLKIDQFIDQFIKQVFSKEDQQLFLKGIDDFEKECRNINGKDFGKCSIEERNQLLKELEANSPKTSLSIWGIDMKNGGPLTFYRRAKELTLLGYFTSREIAKEVLVYDPVPGVYTGDIPLSAVGKISFE